MDKKLKEYLDSGEYLPDFIKDFHDQKNLFKRLDKMVENRDEDYTKDISWTAAQVYTVDVFLWYMAAHGYTLQKSRKQMPFHDAGKDLSEFEKEEFEQKANVLKSFMGQSKS